MCSSGAGRAHTTATGRSIPTRSRELTWTAPCDDRRVAVPDPLRRHQRAQGVRHRGHRKDFQNEQIQRFDQAGRCAGTPPKWSRTCSPRTPWILECQVRLKDYPGDIRQIAATDLGHEKPPLLLTNQVREPTAR